MYFCVKLFRGGCRWKTLSNEDDVHFGVLQSVDLIDLFFFLWEHIAPEPAGVCDHDMHLFSTRSKPSINKSPFGSVFHCSEKRTVL